MKQRFPTEYFHKTRSYELNDSHCFDDLIHRCISWLSQWRVMGTIPATQIAMVSQMKFQNTIDFECFYSLCGFLSVSRHRNPPSVHSFYITICLMLHTDLTGFCYDDYNTLMNKDRFAPTVSIIVPVYQVAPYLRACLDSIVNQSFTDWEMILIDDGSTDGGEQICDEYGAKYDRIRVFHQENRGLSAALNDGLDVACGEYIAMVDADDVLISRDYLLILYDAVKDNDAQVSVCKNVIFSDDSPVPEPVVSSGSLTLLSGKDVFTKEPYCLNPRELSLSCSKLYHKSCFEGVRYPVGRIMEDVAVFHRLIYPCSRIVSLEDRMYGRRIRPGSIITGTKASLQYKDTLSAIEDCIAYFKEKNDQEAVSYAIRKRALCMYYYYFEALKDGSLEDIPSGIRPDVADFENEVDCVELLQAFRRIDPKYTDPHTRNYLSILSNRAMQLLHLSCCYLLHKDSAHDITQSEAQSLYSLATCEGMSAIAHAALGGQDDVYGEWALRSYILMQHEINAFSKCFESEHKRPAVISLIPSGVMNLYAEPWLRYSGSGLFLADMNEVDNKLDPGLFYELPSDISGACGNHLKALFKNLIEEHREMTITEYALFLVAKLHLPNVHVLSTRLCDLLDLSLILHTQPELLQSEAFCKKKNELMPEENWALIKSICAKVISDSSTPLLPVRNELLYLNGFIVNSLL